MKKVLLFLFLTCGVLFSFAEEKKEFPIEKNPKPITGPRTPNFDYDISAYYQNGDVYLQFAYDMGMIEITVTNESTGEQWHQIDDSAFGAVSIATSTSAGNYYITIVTDDGSCYAGSYSL